MMTDIRRDILSVTPLLLTPYRSLVEIGTNYAGAESELYMGSAVLNFDMDTVGRTAIDLLLTDVQKNFLCSGSLSPWHGASSGCG